MATANGKPNVSHYAGPQTSTPCLPRSTISRTAMTGLVFLFGGDAMMNIVFGLCC